MRKARRMRLARLLAMNATDRHPGILPAMVAPIRHARLMACLIDALERRIEREVRLMATIGQLRREHDEVLAELKRHLSPGNENARRGFVVACIRDLAQAHLAASGNAAAADAIIATLEARIRALEAAPAEGATC